MQGSAMPDVASIAAITSSLRAASDIAKAMLGLRDAALLQAKVIELNQLILSAQSSALAAREDQSSLLERVRDLEAEVRKKEAWEAEKQRYQMVELHNGALAYVVKDAVRGTEPTHYICCACYQRDKKSVVQGFKSHMGELTLTCPSCELEITHSYSSDWSSGVV